MRAQVQIVAVMINNLEWERGLHEINSGVVFELLNLDLFDFP